MVKGWVVYGLFALALQTAACIDFAKIISVRIEIAISWYFYAVRLRHDAMALHLIRRYIHRLKATAILTNADTS